jgi:3-hydroxymyristoyl/3-hydroxydecanoyl-(acyl carrier protein) dehydratase
MLETLEDVPGTRRRAKLQVPSSASYFTDHFPRRPVFPATLMLDAALRVATPFVNASPQAAVKYRPARVTNVKMRDFTLPGQTVEIVIEPLAPTGAGPRVSVTARSGERTVATARAEFVAES